MGQAQLVKAGDVEFYVEVRDAGGPRTVGFDETLAFEGIRDTVEAIAAEFASVWERVRPSEASLEFGLAATAKTGKLIGLLVDGGGSATLKVTLTWTGASRG